MDSGVIIRSINDFLLLSPLEQEVFLEKTGLKGKDCELAKNLCP